MFKVYLKVSIIVLFLVVLCSGCLIPRYEYVAASDGPLGPGNWIVDIDQDGIERTMNVHIPGSYDGSSPVPLLLVFHGYMDTQDGQSIKDDFELLSNKRGFIAVYPKGYGSALFQSFNAGPPCCGPAENQDLDDVQLARDIVSMMAERCNIDLSRVYAHGHSNGAGLAHRVAREAADVFAAISPKSMPVLVPNEFPSRPVSVIQFHGTADLTINYNGGTIPLEEAPYISAEESFESWATVNNCVGFPITIPHGSSNCKTYLFCDGDTRVTLCTIQGGGHNNLYGRDDINVSERSWDFMSQYTLP